MAIPLRVAELRADGFRNLSAVRLEPGPEANVFVGANGEGKTSLLEAVDYVATLRSFRGATRAQLVGHDAARATLGLRVEGGTLPHDFRVTLDRKARAFSLDGKKPGRAVEYYGAAACVVFHPEDLELVRGAPEQRRRLLDRILVRVVDGYGEALRTYARALKSRNAILRATTQDLHAVIAYEPQLADAGSVLVRARRALATDLFPAVQRAVGEMALTDVDLSLAYRTRAPEDADAFRALLERSRPQDLARRATQQGPHADDLEIRWRGHAARTVASQGQTRALALSLRLAELHVLRDRTGRLPWLLLDDVSSELDRPRTERLFQLIARLGAQLWVTTTDPHVLDLLPGARRFDVHQGGVTMASAS